MGNTAIDLVPENNGKVVECWKDIINDEGEVAGSVHIRFYQKCGTEPKELDNLGISIYPYRALLDSIKTGDIILFSGGAMLSDVIKSIANSPASHVGFMVKLFDPVTKRKEIFVVESDIIEEGDTLTNKHTDGINITRLSSRLCNYLGVMIVHVPLKKALSQKRKKKLHKYIQCMREKGARFDIKQLVGAGLGIKQVEDLDDVFCSEFVGAGLKQIGFDLKDIVVSEMNPIQVANLDIFETNARLLRFQIQKTEASPII